MLHAVAYVSTIASDLDDLDLADIDFEAQKRNFNDGITGILLCSSTKFFQYFEGEAENCQRLLTRLKQDRRHKNLAVLLDQPVDKRRFPEWTMRVYNIGRTQKTKFQFEQVCDDTLAFLREFPQLSSFGINAARPQNLGALC